MLDDKDEFEFDHYSQWITYLCPTCGGFREQGCSTCAHYDFVFCIVEEELRRPESLNPDADIADIHVETVRRITEAAVV